MQIIDPQKLLQHRELIDCEISSLCLSQEISRPAAYQLMAIDLGYVLRIWPVGTGWWHGMLGAVKEESMYTPPLASLLRRMHIANAALQDLIKRLNTGKIESDESQVILENLINEINLFGDEFPSICALDFIERTIVGVNPDVVATALILRSLDDRIDLFLDSDAFEDLYPNSEWHRLFPPAYVENMPTAEFFIDKQLLLFESKKDPHVQEVQQVQQALRIELRSLAAAGPSVGLYHPAIVRHNEIR